MSAKVRSIAIRPGRDKPIIGTTSVTSTRNARKKLRSRSSRQKPGDRRSISATNFLLVRSFQRIQVGEILGAGRRAFVTNKAFSRPGTE